MSTATCSAEPPDFFHAVKRRITAADAFVGVLMPDDVCTAIEASIASAAGKRILLIVEEGLQVPRLLKGLPGVVRVIGSGDAKSLVAECLPGLLGRTQTTSEPRRT
jgi:hypothetical protein